MSRRGVSLLIAIGAVLLATGCGGTSAYSLAKTRACLAKVPGAKLSNKVDFVASNALGGAVAVTLDHNEVTISFGQDATEAKRIARAYRLHHGRNIGIADVLRPERNAVLLWAAHPSDQDAAAIRDCLK
jgi:hypothetical protein